MGARVGTSGKRRRTGELLRDAAINVLAFEPGPRAKAAAAEAAMVSVRQIERWLADDPDFARQVEERRAAFVAAVRAEMQDDSVASVTHRLACLDERHRHAMHRWRGTDVAKKDRDLQRQLLDIELAAHKMDADFREDGSRGPRFLFEEI
jgi:hypothetical protein